MSTGSARIPLVMGNWKMHTDLPEASTLAQSAATTAAAHPDVEVAILPPAIWLVPLSTILGKDSPVLLGAQDVSPDPFGAFTGDIAAEMVAPYSRFILAGHSERRHLHGEPDDYIRSKLDAIYRVDRIPVLAIGETHDQREAGRAADVVTSQLDLALRNRSTDELQTLVVAYEPVWAIGTGVSATAEDAREMAAFIRDWLRSQDPDAAERIRILYGGSVKPDNATDLFSSSDIDGGLIGGASLEPDAFAAIAAAAGISSPASEHD